MESKYIKTVSGMQLFINLAKYDRLPRKRKKALKKYKNFIEQSQDCIAKRISLDFIEKFKRLESLKTESEKILEVIKQKYSNNE